MSDADASNIVREPGYYWVKYEDKWQPAELSSDVSEDPWYLINYEVPLEESRFEEIGERIKHREGNKLL